MTIKITAEERAAIEPKLNEYERGVLDRAAYFTTFRLKGRDRREFATYAEAVADAAGDPRAMVYAVASDAAAAHLCNGA